MKYPPIFKDVPHMIHGGDYNPDQWLDYPEILSEDIRLMKLAGINSATVAIFAWSALEPREGEFHLDWLEEIVDNLYKNGIYTVLATPSGARPAWLDLAYPEACRTESNGDKRTHGIRQNHCMTSPVFREKVARIDRVLAERFANHPGVKMWHISNEVGGFCYCEKCKQKFRSFLREKYHNNIKELNHEWWTAFWSHTFDDFDQIDPPGPLGENCVHGLNIDWMRFTTWNTCDFLDSEAAVLRQYAPNIPITTNLMGTYRYLNYFEMAKHIDVVSWDAYPQYHAANMSDAETAVDIGFKHDLMRSLLRRPFMLMESTPSCVNWADINKMKRPGMHRLASLQAVAHGADTVQYFQWRKSRGASEKFHGAVVDHEGSENTRVFREVAELGKDLAKLDEIIGTDTPAEVGIVYDWENEWAIADFQGFKHDRKYYETAKDFYRGFFNHARNVDFVPREGDFSRYKLLVAPMLYMTSEKTTDLLEKYVREGGTLVCTYMTGYVNENDLVHLGGFPGGILRKVFGIWAEEMDVLYDNERMQNEYAENELGLSGTFESRDFCEVIHSEGAEVLARYTADYYAGTPCITVNGYGKGKAYFIGTRQSVEETEKIVNAIAAKAGISKILAAEIPSGVKVLSRTDGEQDYIFILNYTTENRTVLLDAGEYTDLLDGKTHTGSVTLEKYGVKVLKHSV